MRATKGPGHYELKLRIGPVAETDLARCPYCHKMLSGNGSLGVHLEGIPGLPERVREVFRCRAYRAGTPAKTASPEADR